MMSTEIEDLEIAGCEPAADGAAAIFLAELLRTAAGPKICSVIEDAKKNRTAIWGAQAGFGQFLRSTYVPLLRCINAPQDRPWAVYVAANAGNTRIAEVYCRSI